MTLIKTVDVRCDCGEVVRFEVAHHKHGETEGWTEGSFYVGQCPSCGAVFDFDAPEEP